MDTQNILTADVLDIIFEGRNKEYGAYELRKTYNRRLLVALAGAALFMVLLYSGYLLAMQKTEKTEWIIDSDVALEKIPEKEIEKPVEIPPKPKPAEPVKTIIFVSPVIVPSDEIPEDEMPPTQDDLNEARIGRVKMEGEADKEFVAPPLDGGDKGIITAPVKRDPDPDSLFIDVQIESEYPGGASAWARFLRTALRNYPEEALDNGIQGTVEVQFIVDREGNVSDVQAVKGPEALRAAAENAIRKSGKWNPAQQNGKKVKSYKRQPITFALVE